MLRVRCVLVSWGMTMVKITRPSETRVSMWALSYPPLLFVLHVYNATGTQKTSCGPYTPTNGTSSRLVYCSLRDILLKHSLSCFLSHRIRSKPSVDEHNHDTISKHRFMQPCPPGLHIYTKIHACCMC